MGEASGGEIILFFVSLVLTLVLWSGWAWQLLRVVCPRGGTGARTLLSLAPLAAAVALMAVLRLFASHDVRDAPFYLAMYGLLGAAWVGVALRLLPYFDLSPRDDAVERGSPAAGCAVAGAVLGLALCYAGANIGDGPGWWVVLFCAALSTGTWFLLWFSLSRSTGLAESITVDRDTAAGLRAAGWFVGNGLILGRAAAGDWTTAVAAVKDFVGYGWPVLLPLAAATALEPLLRPTAAEPRRSLLLCGVLPAGLYVAAGVVCAAAFGLWE